MGANFKSCKFCGSIFVPYNGMEFCQECSRRVDDTFVAIKDYAYEHPNASSTQMIEETQSDARMVNYLIKAGRLKAIARSLGPGCDRCGKPTINGAKFCPTCEGKLRKMLNNANITPPEPKKPDRLDNSKAGDKDKMHVRNSNR